MKLELEHLDKRLHCGVFCLVASEKYNYDGMTIQLTPPILLDWYKKENSLKPILLPLSDLTKEITHKGETFIPIKELHSRFENVYFETGYGGKLMVKGKNENYISHIRMTSVINQLLEWQFDLDELIQNNLAIDVNTLEVNPYK